MTGQIVTLILLFVQAFTGFGIVIAKMQGWEGYHIPLIEGTLTKVLISAMFIALFGFSFNETFKEASLKDKADARGLFLSIAVFPWLYSWIVSKEIIKPVMLILGSLCFIISFVTLIALNQQLKKTKFVARVIGGFLLGAIIMLVFENLNGYRDFEAPFTSVPKDLGWILIIVGIGCIILYIVANDQIMKLNGNFELFATTGVSGIASYFIMLGTTADYNFLIPLVLGVCSGILALIKITE